MTRADFRNHLLVVTLWLGAVGLPSVALSQTAPSPSTPSTSSATTGGATQLEAIEVTGSRLRRADAETALPVTTLSRDDIARSGVQDMEQLIQYISSADSAGASKMSDLAGLSTYGKSTVSLRGLGEVRTLVLLNGRRLSVFAGTGGAVDINSIPLSAIDRVEVLRDGASTAYGTDAVAGVINFIMRKDYNGAGIFTNQSSPTRKGGGGGGDVNIILGRGDAADGKVSFLLTGDVNKGNALFARDRDFSKSGNVPPFFTSAATPSGRIEGQWVPGATNGNPGPSPGTNTFPYISSSKNYGNPMAPWPNGANGDGLNTTASPGYHATDLCPTINMFFAGQSGRDRNGDNVPDYNNCNFDSASFVGLFPEARRYSTFGSVHARITPDLEYYMEASYSRTQLTEAYQPSPVRIGFLKTDLLFTPSSGVDPAILIQPTNVNFPSQYLTAIGAPTNTPYAVTLRTFLTGPRTELDTNTSIRFVNGFAGNFSFAPDWSYDLSAMYNDNKTSGQVIDGYFSQFALASILNCQPTCSNPTVRDTWNPWAPGGVQPAAVSQALEAAKYKGPTVSGDSTLASIEGTTTTSIGALPGGPIQLALGATARREYYKVDVPAILGAGDIAGLGGATFPQDTSRTVTAAYTEVNLPVIQPLEVNVAGRYDHYNDVGGTLNGKLSTRFQPIREVVLRGSAGTGFRAPTLVELFRPITLGTSEQFVDPNQVSAGPVQANALIGGNPNLKPEKSRQFSLGAVLSPLSDLSFSADYFWIAIDKYITAPSALGLVAAAEAGHPLYGPNDVIFSIPGDPTSGVDTVNQINRNAASAYVSGLDFKGDYKLPLGGDFGRLGVDFDGTYMDKYVLKTLSSYQKSVGTIVDDAGNPLDVAGLGVVPRWKHALSLNWKISMFTTTFTQNYYSKYRDANNQVDNLPHYVGAQSIFDAQVAAAIAVDKHNLDVAVGARNLFDKNPPLFIGNGSSFQFGYDPTMYDPRARVVYMRVGYSFL